MANSRCVQSSLGENPEGACRDRVITDPVGPLCSASPTMLAAGKSGRMVSGTAPRGPHLRAAPTSGICGCNSRTWSSTALSNDEW